MDLHPDCEQIAFLLGTWRGEGKGEYPTIQPFTYGEEIRFWHFGKPFLAYTQRTWSIEDDSPRHAEAGYWRAVGPGNIELVVVHPTGITEIEEGTVDGRSIRLSTSSVGRTSTAKEVTALTRTLQVDGDVLSYDVQMAAVGIALTHHLSATLRRVPD